MEQLDRRSDHAVVVHIFDESVGAVDSGGNCGAALLLFGCGCCCMPFAVGESAADCALGVGLTDGGVLAEETVYEGKSAAAGTNTETIVGDFHVVRQHDFGATECTDQRNQRQLVEEHLN